MENEGIVTSAFHTTKGKTNRFQLNFRNHRKIVVIDGKSIKKPQIWCMARYARQSRGPHCKGNSVLLYRRLVLGKDQYPRSKLGIPEG
jgi:hypothetical protein